MKLIVFSLLLAMAATFPQDIRRYRYIPPRYEDYEDVEATPLTPTLNNALPTPASSPSSSITQRPNPISPDVGQPEISETPQIPDNPSIGGSQSQSQGPVTDQGQLGQGQLGQGQEGQGQQGQGQLEQGQQGQGQIGQGQQVQGQSQGTDFNQIQGQIPNVGQGQGSNGQGLEPDLNQGSNVGLNPDSDFNQGQRPDFGQGQRPDQGFQSVTPVPNPIPSPIPKPRPRPRPAPIPQPVFPSNKPGFSGPCGRYGCWGTQPVYPWSSWNHAPSGHSSQAVPYYPQFDYEDERQTRRYLPPKFW